MGAVRPDRWRGDNESANFRRTEIALIVLAVIAVLLAILTSNHHSYVPRGWRAWSHNTARIPYGTLHFLVILTPILISVVGAYNSHFRDGNKWVTLRDAAEALKRGDIPVPYENGSLQRYAVLRNFTGIKAGAQVASITSALEHSEVEQVRPAGAERKERPGAGDIPFARRLPGAAH